MSGRAVSVDRFVEAQIARLRRSRPSLESLAPDSVRGSLFDGAAGVAFFLHEAARLRDPNLLELAERWCALAEQWARRASGADWEGHSRWGHLHGLGGVAYARILVSCARGDPRGVARGVAMLTKSCAAVRKQHGWAATTLFDGAGGLLCVLEQVSRLGGNLQAEARRLGASLWPLLERRLSEPISRGARLGMAHGVAGEIWAAAEWEHDERPLPDCVRRQAATLLGFADSDDSVTLWPKFANAPFGTEPHHFCNGMTGHAFLRTALAQRAGAVERGVAQRTARAVLLLGPSANASLCCGLAGQAVVHGVMGRAWSSPIHVRRSYARLGRAVDLSLKSRRNTHALSLWPGPLGVGLVALLRGAGESHFPCLESPIRRARSVKRPSR